MSDYLPPDHWKTHPLLLNGTAVPNDGLHLVVDGKAWWVSPALLRSWISADPDSPTMEDHCRTTAALKRITGMAAALREEAGK